LRKLWHVRDLQLHHIDYKSLATNEVFASVDEGLVENSMDLTNEDGSSSSKNAFFHSLEHGIVGMASIIIVGAVIIAIVTYSRNKSKYDDRILLNVNEMSNSSDGTQEDEDVDNNESSHKLIARRR